MSHKVVVLIADTKRHRQVAQLETTTDSDDLSQLPANIQDAVEQYDYDTEGESED